MRIRKDFELKTDKFTYREYKGGLIIHPKRPEGWYRRPGQDRLDGVRIIPQEELSTFVEVFLRGLPDGMLREGVPRGPLVPNVKENVDE